ncbi:very short patch repair endonuclease [Massilia sp. IC2-476]|uniref:very short patch repair endonuclease n=1 Tax=Massilia sp. IC2-476 TaxID=2887199 RepID=UPI001D11DE54|nr:very short patch repair endonuclease [Massilia sp. IC2-476]MCC2972666.1 very short patch repair endonuclease [Massilia sp. IC2-476]
MDKLTPARRSWLMGRVKSKNTSVEMAVRRLVFSMGFRYRLHVKALPGTPDLVFAGRKKVVFVNGCFWHGHEGCKYARLPKDKTDFWEAKVARNRERDAKNNSLLESAGWKVHTVWQCELKNLEKLTEELNEFLR